MARKQKRPRKEKRRARAKAKQRQASKARSPSHLGPKGLFRQASAGPVEVCQMSASWEDPDSLVVVAFARRWRGELVGATLLVDRGCLGVKNCGLLPGLDPSGVSEWLTPLRERFSLVDIEPGLAVALVDQAVAFANGLGFKPHRDFGVGRQLLAGVAPTESERERTRPGDRDGRPRFVEGPNDPTERILRKLQRAVGPDGFTFIAQFSDDDAIETWVDAPLGRVIVATDIQLEPGRDLPGRQERLVRLGEIKRALVLFAGSSEFAPEREDFSFLESSEGPLAERRFEALLDRFLYSSDDDGVPVIEWFLDQFADRLAAWEVDELRGWLGWVETAATIIGHTDDALSVRDLATNQELMVWSNLGESWLDRAPDEGVLVGRFVPFEGGLMPSGPLSVFPAEATGILLYELALSCQQSPRALYRDPELLEASRESQRAQGRAFEEELGGRVVAIPGSNAGPALDRVTRRWQAAIARTEEARSSDVPAFAVPDEVQATEQVWLLHDDRYGLSIDPHFGDLERLLANPEIFDSEPGLAEWVTDLVLSSDCDPQPLVMAARRNPKGASVLLECLLDEPGFDWARSGEERIELIHYGRGGGPMPRTVALPSHLTEALRAGPPDTQERVP